MLMLVEICVPLFAAIIIITQILIPVWQNRAMFPIFRKERKLKAALTELEQASVEQQLSDQLETTAEAMLAEMQRRKASKEKQVK